MYRCHYYYYYYYYYRTSIIKVSLSRKTSRTLSISQHYKKNCAAQVQSTSSRNLENRRKLEINQRVAHTCLAATHGAYYLHTFIVVSSECTQPSFDHQKI